MRTDEYPLSTIEGPPGTGKTRTIAAFLVGRTTVNKDEQIMICAPRNVAVRKLVEDAVSLMRSDGLHDDTNRISPLPLVHVETEGIIDASYLCAEPPSDALAVRRQPWRYGAFHRPRSQQTCRRCHPV